MYSQSFTDYSEVLIEIEQFQTNILNLEYSPIQEKNVKFIIKCLSFCVQAVMNDNIDSVYRLKNRMVESNSRYEPGYGTMQYRKQCQIICHMIISIYEKEQEAKVIQLFRNEVTKTLLVA